MKKILSVVLSVQVAVSGAFAQEKIPLARGPNISDSDLNQFIKVNPEYTSLSQHILEIRIQDPERTNLLNKFDIARKDFLESSFSQAKTSFKTVSEKALTRGWPETDRKIIQTAMLRLAQLSVHEEREWLLRAARFAPDLNADSSLFPPPLVEKFKMLKNQVKKDSKKWKPTFASEVQFIAIDGRIYRAHSGLSLLITAGDHRLEVISNIHASDSQVLSREQIMNYEFSNSPLVMGNCDSPKVSSELTSKAHVLYSLDCVVKEDSGKWVNLLTPQVQKAQSESAELSLPTIPELKQDTSNSWIWWTLAGLAAVSSYAYYEQNRSKRSERVEPTHESGIKK